MSLKEFTEEVAKQVQERMGGVYIVKTSEVSKNNGVVWRSIQIMEKDVNISPCIFMEGYFERWKNCRGWSMDRIVDEILETYQQCAIHQNIDFSWVCQYDMIRQKLRGSLINAERNRKSLETMPHRQILDLCLTYYLEISIDEKQPATIPVNNGMMEQWGISEEELYEDMLAGLEREKSVFDNLESMIARMMDCEEPQPLAEMYVLTNQKKLYGAVEMLNTKLLREIAEKMEMDLLILPSSIHELIILPEIGGIEGNNITYLANLVQSINDTELMDTEVLSAHVYRFERRRGEMKIAR